MIDVKTLEAFASQIGGDVTCTRGHHLNIKH